MMRLSTLKFHPVVNNSKIVTPMNLPKSRTYRNLASVIARSPTKNFHPHGVKQQQQPLFLSRFRSYTTESMTSSTSPRILTGK